ncbi:uncharacterized protein hts isoform X1 [Drosophila bipectinata]|uniref:uncharacterized protein hts isoform X1 n=1 Tax=Drosophila bipectinata TaxID=42026 RepID=UPI0038B2D091
MTEVEQPPQNGIDPTAGEEDDSSKARPADIEQDMREMERRKRVEAIMGSKLFREELERIVDSARDGGSGASGILQQLSDIVGVPVTRVGSVFKSSSCMVPINDIRGVESMGYAKGEKILRCKLAATFRLLDLYGWTQGLGALISARLKVDQEYFLVNPYGLLYHEITASALNKVDMQGQIVEQGTTNFGVNKSHFVLHSVVHAARPDIRCAIYIGASPVVAISSLKSGLLPLTKDACVLGEVTTHAYTGLFDEEERNRLVRSLGPNSKVMLLANHGALCCGETIEEAFFAASHIVQACETQLKLLPVGVDNLVLIPEESRKAIYEQSRRPPEDLEKKFAAVTAGEDGAATEKDAGEAAVPKIGSPPKWRVGGADFEALMRMLDNAGYRTGYIYRHPLIKSDPPKPKNDVELPPAVSSLGYLLEEEDLIRQGIWKKGDLRKGGDRSRWLNSPNVYQKVEVLETGTPDPKKITKWVAEGSPTHSTPVRIEDPLQFVPAGTNTREFKRVQQQIKDNRRADKISAGPQSHILEGVTWDEASRLKDATVSQAGDHVVMMGAASKGIIQRGFQHNATVYKAPYAKNPFDNVTDDELNEYKRTVERKKKSIHGEYTDTDFSESEAVLQAGAKKYPQSEPETEHQVIEIQTQQAPVPRQAEVVLSDDNDAEESQIDEQDKENQHRGRRGSSKSRKDLLPLLTEASNMPQDHLYSYVYGAAGSWGQCLQPQVCSALLRALHSEQLGYLASCYQGGAGTSNAATSSSGTITTTHTTATGSSAASRRPLRQANQNQQPPPYRTGSHFGFMSPRQLPRTEHKHLPSSERDRQGYRPMQRAISYEEIFASPRYEHLCQFCFEQLLRLKPELQRIGGGTGASSCEEDFTSIESSNAMTPTQLPKQLPPVPELADDDYDYSDMLQRPSIHQDASTQTGCPTASASATNFLNQIERFNFSEESTNVGYIPNLVNSEMSIFGLEASSAGASATSAAPPRIYHPNGGDITEVWGFGRWQEALGAQMIQSGHQPLTEHRLTLEITENFETHQMDLGPGAESLERQLMTREERQRRKFEFEELWQDHVEYYTGKEEMLQEEAAETVDFLGHTVQLCLGGNRQRTYTFPAQDWNRDQESEEENEEQPAKAPPNDDTLTDPTDELPGILESFEKSLTVAGENLEKLVATTKQLQTLNVQTSSSSLGDRPLADIGNLFPSSSLENIPEVSDQASVLEEELEEEFAEPANPSMSSNGDEFGEEITRSLDPEEEEKRDDEKPVSPDTPEVGEPSAKEKEVADEKDIDENELKEQQDLDGQFHELAGEVGLFTPLEREILQRIETDRLDDAEPIFGKIDHTIRNKLTPKKLQDMVSEEIFRTCTYVYTSSPAAIMRPPGDTPSTPSGSSLSAHNISAPCSSTAHTHLVIRPTPRMSRSWAEVEDGDHQDGKPQVQMDEEQGLLERAVSSTTFVCRPSARRKRNFIQENIRNACRPRAASGSVQKPRGNVTIGALSARPSPTTVCAFQCGQRDSGARLWVSLPTSPSRSRSGTKRGTTASPTRALYNVRRSPTSPYPKRRKPLVLLPPLRGADLAKKPSNGFEPSSSSLSLHESMLTSTFFVPSNGQADDHQASIHTFPIEDLNEEEQEEQDEKVDQDEQEDQEDPANNSQADSSSAVDKANGTTSTMYYSANSTTEDGEHSQPSEDGEDLEELGFRLINSEENPEGETFLEVATSNSGEDENTSHKSEEEAQMEKNSLPENDIESTITNLFSGESQIPSQSENSEVENSSEAIDNGETSTSPPEVSEEQGMTDEEPISSEDQVNGFEPTPETKELLEDEQSRLEGGFQSKMSKSSGSSDKPENTDADDDSVRSSFSLNKARELNPILSEHSYLLDAVSSDDDKAEEKVIKVTKSETNMAKGDDQPSTSKASDERKSGGAEAIPKPPASPSYFSMGQEDEDVVVLETKCTVVGQQMFVREVGVKDDEQATQSNGWIKIEGMMGDDDDYEGQEPHSGSQEIDEEIEPTEED